MNLMSARALVTKLLSEGPRPETDPDVDAPPDAPPFPDEPETDTPAPDKPNPFRRPKIEPGQEPRPKAMTGTGSVAAVGGGAPMGIVSSVPTEHVRESAERTVDRLIGDERT